MSATQDDFMLEQRLQAIEHLLIRLIADRETHPNTLPLGPSTAMDTQGILKEATRFWENLQT